MTIVTPMTIYPSPQDETDAWIQLLPRITPYRNNGNELDQWFIELIESIVQIPIANQEPREAAIARFLQAIYLLPNLYLPRQESFTKRFSDVDREVCRDRLLAEQILPTVRAKIHEFYPTGKFLTPTLGNWINQKLRLKYLQLDEYKNRHPDAALDDCLQGANEQLEWKIWQDNPTLAALDPLIAAAQAKNSPDVLAASALTELMGSIARILGNTPTQRFIDYVKTDPNGMLQAKTMPGHPTCTYQVLIQRLYLQDPPTTKRAIATQFDIPYQALNAHYIRHVEPAFIERIILEEGFFDVAHYLTLKQYIEDDPQHQLRTCHLPNKPNANAQFLAMRRLRFCCEADPVGFDILVQDEAIAAYRHLTPEQLENFWARKGLPLVAQLAMRVLAYELEG